MLCCDAADSTIKCPFQSDQCTASISNVCISDLNVIQKQIIFATNSDLRKNLQKLSIQQLLTMLSVSDEAVARLFNMGFSTEDSTKALKITNYDFDKALEYLIKV